MTATLETLRPNGTDSLGSWALTGAATAHAATSDNLDSSYLNSAGAGSLVLELGSPSITGEVDYVQLRLRLAAPGGSGQIRVQIYDPSTNRTTANNYNISSSSVLTYVVAVRTTDMDGGDWSVDLLNRIQIVISPVGGSSVNLYEVYFDIYYNQPPTVVPLTVSSTLISQPTLTTTYSDPEGDPQERHEMAVFVGSITDPFGANLSFAIWYSGEVFTTGQTEQVGIRLQDQTTYWAYARAADVGSGGVYGGIAGVGWTTTFDPVGTPALAVMYSDETTASVENVSAQGRPNLLARNTASLETDTSGWTNGPNTNIAQVTTTLVFRGAASLSLTAIANGDISATTEHVPIGASLQYTGMITVFTGVSRTVDLYLSFYDSGGTLLSQVMAEGTERAATWTRAWVSARAPVLAATASVTVAIRSALSGEVHNVDAVLIAPITPNPVDNSDFHENLTHGWTLVAAGTSTATLRSASGARSVQLYKNDTNDAAVQPSYYFAAQTGESLILSVDLWLDWITAGTVHATLMFLWSDGTHLDTSISDLSAGQWVRRSYQVTVPSSVTSFLVIVSAGNKGDGNSRVGILVDNVQLERVPHVDFVNGDFETTFTPGLTSRQDLTDGIGWHVESYATEIPTVIDTVTFHGGAKALRLGAAAGVVAITSWHSVTEDVFVSGRTSLSIDYWWRLSNVRQSHAKVTFFDSTRQVIFPRAPLSSVPAGATDSLSSVFIPLGTDSSGDTGWVHRSFASIPIPAGAVWAAITLLGGWSYDGLNPGYTWFDDVTVTLAGSDQPSRYLPGGWTTGGYSSTYDICIERSNDDGVTWLPVRVNDVVYALGAPAAPSSWQVIAPTDYEARPGHLVRYRATALVGGDTTTSTADQTTVQTAQPRRLWIKDPRDHTRNHAFYTRPPGVQPNPLERQVVKQTLGSSDEVVIADTVEGDALVIPIVCLTQTDLDALRLLRSGQRTLLVQNHLGWQWYTRLGPSMVITPVDAAPVTNVDLTGIPQLAPTT